MKQVTLCVYGNGYTEPYNCQIDLAPEDRLLIPSVGDVVGLPGMLTPQVVRSRFFWYTEGGILVILNNDKIRPSNSEATARGNLEEK
jgi:hypothetical protein